MYWLLRIPLLFSLVMRTGRATQIEELVEEIESMAPQFDFNEIT